jgi:hypothetical protein
LVEVVQGLNLFDGHAPRSPQRRRRTAGRFARRRIDNVQRVIREVLKDAGNLLLSADSQREVEGPLDPVLFIEIRAAWTNQKDL